MTDDKADKLMEEGEKRLTKFAPFTSSEEKHEKARDKFLQAATQYKANQNWSRAAAAYVRASEMASKVKSEIDFISDCEEAAKCYRKAKDGRANDLFMRVVDMYDRQQKYSQAAKYCIQIAENSEGKDSIEWRQRAQRYYRNDGSKVTANDVGLQMTDTYAQIGDYEEARKIFDKQARDALDDRISRGGARKLFFQALLCQIANINPESIAEGVEQLSERFQEYQDLDNQFNEHTREHMLIRDLIVALEEQDIKKYEDAVAEYDSIVPLDEKKSKMLLKGKQALRQSDIR